MRDDHERPLTARGRMAASLMGRYMHDKGYLPALVLCSTAVRARETLDIILPAFEASPKVHYEDSLYLAEWPRLLEVLHAAPGEASPLLLVGHNPGLEQLAMALLAKPKTAAIRALAGVMAQKFPTTSLAVLNFRGKSWDSLKPGTGRLVDFMRPKDFSPAAGGEAN
jgi:phosphohistidine phosphatase